MLKHGVTRAARAVLIVLCGIATVCLVLHYQAAGGGRYDRVVEVLALEHWHETGQLLPGRASISGGECPLHGLFYSAFRFARVGPCLGAECVSIAVRTAGFCSFYLAAWRLLDLKPGWATLAAVAFTLGSSALVPASQDELVSFAFAPAIAVLLQGTAEALRILRRTQAIVRGTLAACLYAVWQLTATYAACVFLLLLVFAALAYLVVTRCARLRVVLEFAPRSSATRTPRYPAS